LLEFQQRFGDEEACRAYLVASRWPDGFRCPRCAESERYELRTRPLLVCRACGHQTSVTAGTVLHRSRVPLQQWFWAAYLLTTQTPGVSATQLQRQLGLSRYETAWAMLQKLRRAMLRPEREPLGGIVEVDETFLGGVERGRRGGRQRDSAKIEVVAAVEIRGEGSGRARLAVVTDSSQASLVGFVRANVTEGAIVRTDGWQGYAPLRHHYDHRPVTQGHGANAGQILPRVHRLFSNLKTWLAGTHHGIGRKHVRSYLDEFVFRFNRRRTPMAAFQSLLGLTASHGPTTYKMLYRHEANG
jgi:transposase-like protein